MDCSRVDCESRLVMKSLNMTIPMMMKMMRRQTMMHASSGVVLSENVRCRLSSNPMVWLVRLLGHLRLGGFYIHACDHWVVRVSIQTYLQTFSIKPLLWIFNPKTFL